MTDMLTKQSPIQPMLESLGGPWSKIAGGPISVHFSPDEIEKEAFHTLALCDLSPLPKLGIQGRSAAAWLAAQGVAVPGEIYESAVLADGGCLVRLSAIEFLLLSPVANQTVPAISDKLEAGQDGVIRVERQEALFLLTGSRATEILTQVCAFDFRTAKWKRLVMTRIAGVSGAILPWRYDGVPTYKILVDATYAIYLWKVLAEISTELGGKMIGALGASGYLSNANRYV